MFHRKDKKWQKIEINRHHWVITFFWVQHQRSSVTLPLNSCDKIKAMQSFLLNCNTIFLKKKKKKLNIWELFSWLFLAKNALKWRALLAFLHHTKTLITEGTMGCTEHYHLSTNVFIINWIATAFIHWDSGHHKNSIETNLIHMNVLSECRNEVIKSLEKRN